MINQLVNVAAMTIAVSIGFTANAYAAAADVDCDKCIGSTDIAGGAVNGSKIGKSAVVTSKIKGGAVTTSKIKGGAVTTLKIKGGAVTTSKIKGGAVTGAKLSATVQAKLNDADTITGDGIIDDSEASDDLSINNGLLNAPSGGSTVSVDGVVTQVATLTLDGSVFSYIYSNERYVVEASSSVVGVVQPLDHTIVSRLCKDIDGCNVTLAMVDFSFGQLGAVASQSERMFYSQNASEPWWRMSNFDPVIQGKDGDAVTQEFVAWDCYLTDAETEGLNPNDRTDSNAGFGLLNASGGGFPDGITKCRVIIED